MACGMPFFRSLSRRLCRSFDSSEYWAQTDRDAGRNQRQFHRHPFFREQAGIEFRDLPAPLDLIFKNLQFAEQDRGLQGIEAAVDPQANIFISVLALAMHSD